MNSRYTPAHITAELPQSLSPFGLGGATVRFIEDDEERFYFKHQLDVETVRNSCDTLFLVHQQPSEFGDLIYSFKASVGDISIDINDEELSFNEPGRQTIHQNVVDALRELGVEPQMDMIYYTGELDTDVFRLLMDYFFQRPESKYILTIEHVFDSDMPTTDLTAIQHIQQLPFSQPIQSDEQIKHFMRQAEEYYRQQDSHFDGQNDCPEYQAFQVPPPHVATPVAPVRPLMSLMVVPGFKTVYGQPLLIVKSMVAKLGVAIAGIYDRTQEQFIAFCVLTYLGYQAIPPCCADEFKNFNNVIIGPESMMRDYASMFERDGIKLLLPLSILDAAVDEDSKRLLSTLFPDGYLVDYRKHTSDAVAENMVLNKLAALTMRNSI